MPILARNENNCNSYLFANALKDSKHLIADPRHITTPFCRESGLDRLFHHVENNREKKERVNIEIAELPQ